ncbi:MAG: aldolase/citrate lyase family protein, partial [Gemmatimonadota bacterium]|nr:aldolase/citrate lyase family protein [Gemmatimonadota bacterium]
LGLRGLGCGRDSDYGTLDPTEYMGGADAETILGVMIEDAEGVEEVEAIAAIEGIDLLFVGPSDLAHSYGVEREGVPHIDHERVLAAFDRVGAACAASGKAMGTAVGPGESMRRVVAKGTRWLNCCHDMSALTSGLRSARQATLGAKQRTITQQLLDLYHRGELDLDDVSGTAKRHDFSRSMVNHLASFVQHKAKCVEALPEVAPLVERMEQALVDGRRGLALTDAYYVCLAVQNLPKERWLEALQATFDRWEHAATGSFKTFFDEVKERLQAE